MRWHRIRWDSYPPNDGKLLVNVSSHTIWKGKASAVAARQYLPCPHSPHSPDPASHSLSGWKDSLQTGFAPVALNKDFLTGETSTGRQTN